MLERFSCSLNEISFSYCTVDIIEGKCLVNLAWFSRRAGNIKFNLANTQVMMNLGYGFKLGHTYSCINSRSIKIYLTTTAYFWVFKHFSVLNIHVQFNVHGIAIQYYNDIVVLHYIHCVGYKASQTTSITRETFENRCISSNRRTYYSSKL